MRIDIPIICYEVIYPCSGVINKIMCLASYLPHSQKNETYFKTHHCISLTTKFREKIHAILGRFYSTAMFDLINSLVEVTVPEELPSTYEALAVLSTADARTFVDFMAWVNKDEAYMLAEVADITPEERVGLFKMRARIEQMKFRQKQALVSITVICLVLPSVDDTLEF